MTLARRCTCIAALALTATALATPTAWSRPVDMPPAHAETNVSPANDQDLRSADAIDAATRPTTEPQDLRSADAIDAAPRPATEPQDLRSPDAIDAATRPAPERRALGSPDAVRGSRARACVSAPEPRTR